MTKGVPVLLAAACAAGLMVLVVIANSRRGELSPAPAGPLERSDRVALVPGDTPPLEAAFAERRAHLVSGPPAVEPMAAASGQVDAQGQVVGRDAGGREHTGLNGRLWVDVEGRPQIVPVVAGTYRLTAAGGALVQVQSAELDGRRGAPAEGVSFRPRNPPGRIVVSWFEPLTLEVLDAQNGRHLAGVRVAVDGRDVPDPEARHHPGRRSHWIAQGRSPLSIENWGSWSRRPDLRIFVSAPGYGWTDLVVDPYTGGTHTLRMTRAADLEVRFSGAWPEVLHEGRLTSLWLSVSAPDGRGGGDQRDRDFLLQVARPDPQTMRELAPGPALVRLERRGFRGGDTDGRTTLAEVEVELLPGEATIALLELPMEENSVRVAGTLHLPEVYGARLEGVLSLRRLGQSPGQQPPAAPLFPRSFERDLLDGERWHFHFESPGPGPHLFLIGPTDYPVPIEVPPGGREGLELSLPLPLVLRVCVADASPGGLPERAMIRYASLLPPGAGEPAANRARALLQPESGCAEIFLPPGPALVRFAHPARLPDEVRIDDAGSIRAPILLHTGPVSSLRLALTSQGAPLPVGPQHFAARLVSPDREQAVVGRHRQDQSLVLIAAPGSYHLHLDPGPSFAPPAPIQVHLVAGETSELVVELAPR